MEISNNFIPKDLAKTFEVFINKTPLNTLVSKSNDELQEDKFEKKYGMLYTSAAALTGIGILLLLLKGGKLSGINKFIQKHCTELAAKTAEAKTNIKNMDLWQRTKFTISEAIVNASKRTQSFGNVNPIKDIAFDRFAKFIHVKPFFDGITKFFTNLSKNLTLKKYNAPRKSLIEFKKELQTAINVIRNSKKPNAEELAKTLENLASKSSEELVEITKGFEERFNNVLHALNKPVEIFANNSVIKRTNIENKFLQEPLENLLNGFIPRKTIAPMKKELFENLFMHKMNLSNSVVDFTKALHVFVDDIFKNAPMEKTNIRKNYLTIKELIRQFETPELSKRADIKTKLIESLKKATTNFEPKSSQTNMLEEMQKFIANDKKGTVEEILSQCKKFGLKELQPDLYKKLTLKRNKFQANLGEAVKFETENTFGKMLDYSLHSLPTDMMTQAVGMGTLLYILLNRKKSKNEKISSTLQNGIPIIGGLGVMFACNVRQVASGPSALFLGILSTIILNRLGKVANKQYLAYNSKNQKILNDNKTTQIA